MQNLGSVSIFVENLFIARHDSSMVNLQMAVLSCFCCATNNIPVVIKY